MTYPQIDQLLDLLEVDAVRVERGRRRQAAVWRRESPDGVPILLGRSESRQVMDRVGPQCLRLCEHQLRGGRPVPEYHDFDHYTLRQQFDNPEAMLTESLWDIIGWARSPGDQQLSLRPNFGVGTVASIFGCGTDMREHEMPWVADRPPKERLLDVDFDRLDESGLIPRVIAFVRLARETLKGFPQVRVFMPDFQGPMGTAFLLRQQDIFLDMLDDEAFFRRLMDTVTEVFIRLTRRLKQELGEPLDSGWHGSLYMADGGVRVVDDVSIMLSPEQYREFSLPYVRRCLEPFGGGWIHSCGDISHLLGACLETPEIRGINFGEPQYYDFDELLPRFAAAGKFCYGGPVRRPGEPVSAYLRRTAGALRGCRNTLIFIPRYGGPDMSEGDWPDPAETVETWQHCVEGS